MGFLTDLKIRSASPSAKEYLLADGDGLYLRVRSTSKSWLYRYKSDDKQVKVGLGAYPTVTLAMARTLTKEANALRSQGTDPQDARREQQEQAKIAKMNTFELMARAWLESASKDRIWSAGYKSKVTRHLEIHVFPWVGDKAMETIRHPKSFDACIASKIAATWKRRSVSGRPSSMSISTLWIRVYWSPPRTSSTTVLGACQHRAAATTPLSRTHSYLASS